LQRIFTEKLMLSLLENMFSLPRRRVIGGGDDGVYERYYAMMTMLPNKTRKKKPREKKLYRRKFNKPNRKTRFFWEISLERRKLWLS
jgi:hypothetical protein